MSNLDAFPSLEALRAEFAQYETFLLAVLLVRRWRHRR